MNAFNLVGRTSSISRDLRLDSTARVNRIRYERRKFKETGRLVTFSSASVAALKLHSMPNGECRK